MSRIDRFTFLCDEEDRAMLAQVASALHRNQSDALRIIIREVHSALRLAPPRSQALPDEVANALQRGELTLKDLEAESLGLGDLARFDLTSFEKNE